MKQCPNCKTTYADDSLQFCLNDGANLIVVPDAAQTVQMSFANEPMRISIPPDSAPTIFPPQMPPSQNQPVKKAIGLIVAGVIALFLFLMIAGIAGFVFYYRSGNDNPIAAASPPSVAPKNSPTAAPDDETAKLREEMANLKKQLEDQKTQKPDMPITAPPNQNGKTARANSPRDGFLALRTQPDSETGTRIAKIPHGATLTVLGCPKASNVGKMAGRWCQVVYNGQSGWAFDAFMIFQ